MTLGSLPPGPGAGGGAVCLLLVPRGFDAPAELLDGLRQRGVGVHECADAPAVMVGLARRSYVALIVVEPGAIADVHGLRRAVGRYHSRLPIWRYRKGAEPRLARLEAGENGHGAPASVMVSDRVGSGNGAAAEPDRTPLSRSPITTSPGSDRRAVEDELRADEGLAAGRGGVVRLDESSAAPVEKPAAESLTRAARPADEPPLLADLTDEELAMLLAPDPQDTEGRR